MSKIGKDKENARHFVPYLSAFGELRRLGALPKRGIIPRISNQRKAKKMAGIIRKNSAGAKWIYHQVSRRDKEQVMAMRALIRHWRACGYSDAAIIAMGKEMI